MRIQRKEYQFKCHICAKSFSSNRKHAKYCGGTCRAVKFRQKSEVKLEQKIGRVTKKTNQTHSYPNQSKSQGLLHYQSYERVDRETWEKMRFVHLQNLAKKYGWVKLFECYKYYFKKYGGTAGSTPVEATTELI